MGALPKNKITRCERGKRRSGNTPNLLKNPQKTNIPLGKKRLADQILKQFSSLKNQEKKAAIKQNKKSTSRASKKTK